MWPTKTNLTDVAISSICLRRSLTYSLEKLTFQSSQTAVRTGLKLKDHLSDMSIPVNFKRNRHRLAWWHGLFSDKAAFHIKVKTTNAINLHQAIGHERDSPRINYVEPLQITQLT